MKPHLFLLILLLTSCATPVLDLPEPPARTYTAARLVLAEVKLAPVPTLADFDRQVEASRPARTRVRDAAIRVCHRLKLSDACDARLKGRALVVNEPDTINANADKHDTIRIYTGLIDRLGVEAELAGVVAHESAHVLLGHVDKTLTNAAIGGVIAPVLLGGLAVATGVDLDPSAYFNVADVGAVVGSRAYSPEMELEADRLAVYILQDAGYPVTAMRDALVRLHRAHVEAQSSGLGAVGFLETHPSSDRRLAHMLQNLEDMGAGAPWNTPTLNTPTRSRPRRIQPALPDVRVGVPRKTLRMEVPSNTPTARPKP